MAARARRINMRKLPSVHSESVPRWSKVSTYSATPKKIQTMTYVKLQSLHVATLALRKQL